MAIGNVRLESGGAGATCILPRRILLAVDGSPLSDSLVSFAASMSKPFHSSVTVLRVLGGHPVHGRVDVLEFELERAAAQRHLERIVDTLGEIGVSATPLLAEGRPAEQIASIIEERAFDLLLLSSHGEGGLTEWCLGGTAQRLIHLACSSLLVVPSRFGALDKGIGRILVPLDGSKRSECVLPLVEGLAAHHEAEVVLFHVVVEPEMPRRSLPSREDQDLVQRLIERNTREAVGWLGDIAARLRTAGLEAQTRVEVASSVYRAVMSVVREDGIDLVVLCAHGAAADPGERHGGLPARCLRAGIMPTLVVQDMPMYRAVPSTPTGTEPRRLSLTGGTVSALQFGL